MISYEPLMHTLIRRKLNRERLVEAKIISRPVSAKISKGEYISLAIVDKLCAYLGCRVEDVIAYVEDE